MATERRPWPVWAADGYWGLWAYSHIANKLADKVVENPHHNIYLTSSALLKFQALGQKITALAKETQLAKKGDDQQWPKWAAAALETARLSGLHLKAGAKHGLSGLNLDGKNGENWARVTTGLSTCIEHAHKIQAALAGGPQPEVDFLPDDLFKTLEMGEQTETPTGNKWTRNSDR